MKDAIFFDLDGTLWDSSKEVASAWDGVTSFLERPFHITQDDVRGVMGLPMDVLFKTLFKGRVRPEDEEAIIERLEKEENAYLIKHPGRLFPKVEETLKALQPIASLYVVSNCQKGYIEAFLEGTGLGPCFAGHLSYGDTGMGKGRNIALLKDREGIARLFYLGDTEGDRKACIEAKAPFLFAAYGFGETDAPERIESFGDLLGYARSFFEKETL